MSFYTSLSVIERLFFFSAVLGASLLIVRVAASLLGGDDGDADLDFDADVDLDLDLDDVGDGDPGFNILSLQGLSAFFLMFGLVGLAMTRSSGLADGWGVVGGLLAGIGTMFIIAQIFVFMKKLQSDGTVHVKNAVGAIGTVYLNIPEKGTGQVQIPIQGSLRVQDARALNGAPIDTGERVKVVRVSEGIVLVEHLTEE